MWGFILPPGGAVESSVIQMPIFFIIFSALTSLLSPVLSAAGAAVQRSAQPGGHVWNKKDLGHRSRPLPAGALEERHLIGR